MAKTENVKSSLVETGKNLGSGLVGMVAGSAVGRHSLWIGAITIFGGAWYQHDWLTSAGVGMVASNGFGPNPDVSGLDGFQDEVEKAKHRTLSSLKALGKKVYLDKLSPSLSEKMGLQGLEDATILSGDSIGYLNDYPVSNFDTGEVDAIIRQLEDGNANALVSADQFQGGEPVGELMGDPLGDLGALGNAEINELAGQDALELNAIA